jgi:2'-5' RNA ligase
VAAPDDARLLLLTDAIQEDPRRYGFHATLRAPFELAEGRTEAQLIEAANAFARSRQRFSVGPLRPGVMGSFAALLCDDASPGLQQLAADCVTVFEVFRRPLSAPDRERRVKAPLTVRQIAHLDAWGYPYVFEEFVFHMTLTGRLREEDRGVVLDALRELFAPLPKMAEIDAITILVQPSREAAFHVLRRCPFR